MIGSHQSLKYALVDQVVLGLGEGTLLAMMDVEHAYRNLPVHTDKNLLPMRWNDKLDVNTVLPFGLRSAPMIFLAVADAVEWIEVENGVSSLMHYLRRFLLLMGRATTT